MTMTVTICTVLAYDVLCHFALVLPLQAKGAFLLIWHTTGLASRDLALRKKLGLQASQPATDGTPCLTVTCERGGTHSCHCDMSL